MNSNSDLHVLNIVLILLAVAATIIPISNYTLAQDPQGDENSAFPKLPPGLESSLAEQDSLPPALMPDVNFSEPSEFDSPLGPESSEFYFPDVNGTYVNSDVGFQIDLPKDWKGKEILSPMSSVIAGPHGIDLEESEEPGTIMTIQVIDEETFNELADIAQLLGPENEVGEGSLQGSDPLSIEGEEGEAQCNELPASFVTINNIKAEQRAADCSDEEGTVMKTMAYTFATANDSIIVLALSSNSTNEYNNYLPQFEESVKTIKISEPSDIANSELYKKHKELETQTNQTMG